MLLSLVTAALLAVSAVSGTAPATVPVTVYYETLCPDCIHFFVNQLYPSMMQEGLLDYTDLTLIPYAFSTTNKSSDGSLSFTCQHGPNECLGNKVNSCALHYIKDKKKLLTYLHCLMLTMFRDRKVLYPTEKCADLTSIDTASKQSIVQCANSTEGDQLLAAMGELTPKRPDLSWTPTVVLNGNKSQEDIDNAQTDLTGTICKYISDPKPVACGGPKVTVYYETLCPYSVRLFVNELYPALQDESLARSVTIDLVPYGKANTTVSADGSYSFTCQHGEGECYGNKVHACALKKVADRKKLLAYLNCLMEAIFPDRNIPYPAEKCADLTLLADDDKKQIISCANSTEGSALLAEFGKATPTDIWQWGVPAVILNGRFNQTEDDNAQSDFQATVCNLMASPRPAVCGSSGSQDTSGGSMASFSLMLIVAALLVCV